MMNFDSIFSFLVLRNYNWNFISVHVFATKSHEGLRYDRPDEFVRPGQIFETVPFNKINFLMPSIQGLANSWVFLGLGSRE